MGRLDNTIERFSPSWACRRHNARVALEMAKEEKRSYDAAKNDRLTSGWSASDASAQMIDTWQRDTMRNRARDLERNSDVMQAVLEAFERNVIGTGMRLQAKTDDTEINKMIESLWNEWCKPQNCDFSGQQGFREMLRMALRRKKVDGGILIYLAYDTTGVVPLKLQMIEVDSLTSADPRNKRNRVVDGVEIDEYGRHQGYWIQEYKPDNFSFSIAEPRYLPAEHVIFYWTRERPTQVREVSEMYSTMLRIRDITSYMDAEAEKKRIEACFAAVIERNATDGGFGRSQSALKGGSEYGQYDGKTLTPGMIFELHQGDNVKTVSPPVSGAATSDYIRLQQRLIASGQGLSYETVTRDLSQVNYSSARQGLIEDRGTYEIEREALTKVLVRIYGAFLEAAVLSGALELPGFFDARERYTKHIWIPPSMPWIDPLKEANANRVAIESGQTTQTRVLAAQGVDIEDHYDEIARENELKKQVDETYFGRK